jgi:hypothetical protein
MTPLEVKARRRYIAAFVFAGFIDGAPIPAIIEDLQPRMSRPRHARRLPALVVHYYNQYRDRFPRVAAAIQKRVNT